MPQLNYVLGLDLGVSSIGWSMVELDDSGTPIGIVRMGSHIFDAGVEGSDPDIQKGRDSSRAAARRMARQMRKQIRRKALRRRQLLRVLQSAGLVPDGDIQSPAGIDQLLKSVDAKLRATWEADADHRAAQLLPYRIRARGLSEKLSPTEFGRAIYHLNQRRGFLSNRKSLAKEGEETGIVKSSIAELKRTMEAGGFPTIGAYFASLDPTDPAAGRIRGRWTSRDWFRAEFDQLWETQSKHNPALSDELKQRIARAIFFQRPLKPSDHLIGTCDLIPTQRRCHISLREAQRFRMLQAVNNLQIYLPDNTKRGLAREERDKLIAWLSTEGDITFTILRTKKYLNLPKGSTFNLEEGGEKRLIGHRTDAKLREALGPRFDKLSEDQRDELVDLLRSFEKERPLSDYMQTHFNLDKASADAFSIISLEDGYASHCRAAIRRLLPRLEEGTHYMTARKEEFNDPDAPREPLDQLPPLDKSVENLRNPAVARTLTELRKLINTIIRAYGKPAHIRIELARDLKKPRKQREQDSYRMRDREQQRERAKVKILKDGGIANPSRQDVDRVLLAEECGWVCPYTGAQISVQSLLGRHPQFDIEHIWPMSRSLDDSFANKTLCQADENRARKKNRTPYEAYHGTPLWEAILQRVKKFKGDLARTKLERFSAEQIKEGFAARHLAETRYTSSLATEYISLLYGGSYDIERSRRIHVTTGGLTAHLRREWQLNRILSDDDSKNRGDHRHHAIDALIVALTDHGTVSKLQTASEAAQAAGRRLFAQVPLPWETFHEDVQSRVDAINVSHRQSRRVRGPLHADSNYSKPIPDGSGESVRRIRKPIESLTDAEVERISDSRVRSIIVAALNAAGKPPKDAFKDPKNHPTFTSRAGNIIPIHKVRIDTSKKPFTVGKGPRQRHVGPTQGSNHHTRIIEVSNDVKRTVKWVDEPTTLLDAYQRQAKKQPIVPPTVSPAQKLLFSLAANEYLLIDDHEGKRRLCRVLSFSEGDLELVEHWDGRPIDERKSAKARIRTRGGDLQKRNAQKVLVTYLGEIRNAGG
ncbi:MAG: type II CRISPR RNA-guided endonuclease Cas9 [Planctomycetes bacterium]|nr:type II CRISPR RNA-guided endonuclease Cas9 [Planctomycetota bacterium]